MDNESRVQAAGVALEAHIDATKTYDQNTDEDIVDLFTNLMHYASRQGFDPVSIVRMAQANYHNEK